VLLSSWAVSSAAQPAPERPKAESDETAIVKLHQDFQDAWSRGDANALARCFAPDAVRVGAFGDVQRRRSEIRDVYSSKRSGLTAIAKTRDPPDRGRSSRLLVAADPHRVLELLHANLQIVHPLIPPPVAMLHRFQDLAEHARVRVETAAEI